MSISECVMILYRKFSYRIMGFDYCPISLYVLLMRHACGSWARAPWRCFTGKWQAGDRPLWGSPLPWLSVHDHAGPQLALSLCPSSSTLMSTYTWGPGDACSAWPRRRSQQRGQAGQALGCVDNWHDETGEEGIRAAFCRTPLSGWLQISKRIF